MYVCMYVCVYLYYFILDAINHLTALIFNMQFLQILTGISVLFNTNVFKNMKYAILTDMNQNTCFI